MAVSEAYEIARPQDECHINRRLGKMRFSVPSERNDRAVRGDGISQDVFKAVRNMNSSQATPFPVNVSIIVDHVSV